jgi:hypothetical protein
VNTVLNLPVPQDEDRLLVPEEGLHSTERERAHTNLSSLVHPSVLFIYSEDWSSMFLRNVTQIPDYTVSQLISKYDGTSNFVQPRSDETVSTWRSSIRREMLLFCHCFRSMWTDEIKEFKPFFLGACGSVEGWGTMLQAGRSRVQLPMWSLDFSISLILPAAQWPWGRFSL